MQKITLRLIKENGLITYSLLMVFIVGIALTGVSIAVESVFGVEIHPYVMPVIAGLVGVPAVALLLRRKINQPKS